MITTAGKVLIKNALPPELGPAPETLDKKGLSGLMESLVAKAPGKFVDTLQNLNNIGRSVATDYGRGASLSLDAFTLDPAIKKERDGLKLRIRSIVDDPDLPEDDKLSRIKKEAAGVVDGAADRIYEAAWKTGSPFALQIKSGSRGKPMQLQQMVYGDGFIADAKNRTIPYPILSGYSEGLSPFEYWVAASSSRKGLVDTQFATGESGYFSKQITNVAHRGTVTMKDCGTTDTGLPVDGEDADNIGSILLRDTAGIPAGTVLRKEHLPILEGKKILVRSAVTCKAPHGICSKCAGMREKGAFPGIGDAVGVNSAKAFAEPITQAAVGSKHVGGVGSASDTEEEDEFPEGLKGLDQFVQVPKEFAGGATLSRADGLVGAIKELPQGGWDVSVGGQAHYVPSDKKVTVRQGDKIEAGDSLSSGLPNPAEVVGLKGLGEGRRYFLQQYRKMTSSFNADAHRRNLEALTRAFVSKVRITDADGWNGNLPGDTLDYDALASEWEPREGSRESEPQLAVGAYLERPVMHHTIGTRVTPRIAAELKSMGFNNILTHRDPPPFEPVVVRAQSFMQYDPDWLVRLGGENLKKSLVETASRGGESDYGGNSYIPRLFGMRNLEGNNNKEA